MGSGFHHGGRVDDLTAHLLGGLVHRGQTGAVGVGAVDHTGIHAALGDLGGHLLDIGTVGDDPGGSQSGLVQIIIGQNFLGVLAHRHIAVAHAEEDVLGLQVLGQGVKAVDALVAALRHAEHHFVFQQVHAAVAVHKVQPFGVYIRRIGAVQLVHLLLTGRNEHVAVGTFLDLGLEGAGGIKVEPEGHARVLCRVRFADGGQGLSEGGGGKDDELHRFCSGSGGSGGRGCGRAGSGAAAGSQGSGGGQTDRTQKVPAGNLVQVHGLFSCSLKEMILHDTVQDAVPPTGIKEFQGIEYKKTGRSVKQQTGQNFCAHRSKLRDDRCIVLRF